MRLYERIGFAPASELDFHISPQHSKLMIVVMEQGRVTDPKGA